jgi:hypothetical protein
MGGHRSFTETRPDDEDAPKPDFPPTAPELPNSTLSSRSPTLVRLTRHASEGDLPPWPED